MILQNKEIEIIFECSAPTAIKRKYEILNYFKSKSGRLYLHQVAQYEGISEQRLLNKLALKVKNTVKENKCVILD